MRAAYADPPYLGCAVKHYGDHPEAAVYDEPEGHQRLIERLCDEFDTWALSMASTNLQTLLPLCPKGVRVGSWIKPFASFKKNVTRAFAWEPFIFSFHRKRPSELDTWRDFVIEPITLQRGFVGAKPERVCFWMFDGLYLLEGDEFTDIFPGSGAVGEAWVRYQSRSKPEQFELHARGGLE